MYIAVAQQRLYEVAVATDVESEQSAGYRRVQGGRVHSRCPHSGRHVCQREEQVTEIVRQVIILGKIPFAPYRTATHCNF